MNPETTFRKTLTDELIALTNSKELDERLIQMQCVEDKQDILGEFLDYYTDDLLKYKPFTDEFGSNEIEEFRSFLDLLRIAMHEKAPWLKVRTQAESLLAQLRLREI
jgi:hypothetical protein